MADPRTEQLADFRKTIESGHGMGQNADGTFDTFPLADLAKKTAERDGGEAATQYAMTQSEEGFPDDLRAEYAAHLGVDPPEDFAALADAADQDPV